MYETNPPMRLVSRRRTYTSSPYAEPRERGCDFGGILPRPEAAEGVGHVEEDVVEDADARGRFVRSSWIPALDCKDCWRPSFNVATPIPGKGTTNEGG